MHQTAFDSAYTAITADGARWLADNLPSVRLRGWQAGACRPLALGAERQQTAAGSLRDNGMLSLLNVSPWTHTHLPSRQLNAPCLPPTLAAQLRAVGMDYLSVATLEEIVDAHLAILGSVSAQGSAECVRGRAAAALRWMCTAWFWPAIVCCLPAAQRRRRPTAAHCLCNRHAGHCGGGGSGAGPSAAGHLHNARASAENRWGGRCPRSRHPHPVTSRGQPSVNTRNE